MPFGLRTRQPRQCQPLTRIDSTRSLKVTIPQDAVPEQTFDAFVRGQAVKVSCPHNARPGESMYVIVGPETFSVRNPSEQTVVLSNVVKAQGIPDAYSIVIPDNVRVGGEFSVRIEGETFTVQRPRGLSPGNIMGVVVPPRALREQQQRGSFSSSSSTGEILESESSFSSHGLRESEQNMLTDVNSVDVTVPEHVLMPGQLFVAILQEGVPIQVECPPYAIPGSTLRVTIGPQVLDYGKEYDWVRSLRISNMKFRWVLRRHDGYTKEKKGLLAAKSLEDSVIKRAAYARKLEMLPASQYPNIPEGHLSLVPASKARVSSLVLANKKVSSRQLMQEEHPPKFLLTWSDLVREKQKSFHEKAWWFHETCSRKLCLPSSWGHISLSIRRGDHMLGDSLDIVMSLSPEDMRKSWKLSFVGNGRTDKDAFLMQYWLQAVIEEIIDPNKGLWQPSAFDPTRIDINAASGSFCENHLMYFRFLGRMMGRALVDNQSVSGRMAQYLYKHILGFPITFGDLKVVDETCYNRLVKMDTMAREGNDVSALCQDFTTMQDVFGSKQTVSLVRGGKDVPVTNCNVYAYIEACFKHRFLDGIKPQLNALLLGFHDVIPEAMMTIFDFEELELLMCGSAQHDMQ